MIKKIATTLTVLLMFFGCSTTTAEADKPCELPKIEYYGAYYSLSYNEYEAVCAAVMSESGGEEFIGQQAVSQCILNACELTGMRPDIEELGNALRVEFLAAKAEEMGVHFLDAGAYVTADPADGIHMNEEGHAILAEKVTEKVRQIMG